MPRLRLIHWKAEEAAERASRLESAGYQVEYSPHTPGLLRKIRESPPVAIVFDLTRLPSHSREVAVALRGQKATRSIPLVFLGGEPEKVARMRAILPDAAYADWTGFRPVLKKAIASPPLNPKVPAAMMDRYGDTPLAKKLGIKPGASVALLRPPEDFERTLGDLPAGVTLSQGLRGGPDLALWFIRSCRDLDSGIGRIAASPPPGGVWIIYPKLASGLATDLTQQIVRETGLAHGLVDYKICAVDKTWTGLKFALRKQKAAAR